MAVVSFKYCFDRKTPKFTKNPDKTGFPGKSGTLSGPVRPDFHYKNPVLSEIPASLAHLVAFQDQLRGMFA